MSWLSVSDPSGAPNFIVSQCSHALLPVGTVMLECTIDGLPNAQENILHHLSSDRWHREFKVTLHPEGHISVETTQGPANTCAYVPYAVSKYGGEFRISFSWDAPNRIGCLSVLNLETDNALVAKVTDPSPLPVEDALELTTPQHAFKTGMLLDSIAVADHIANPIQKGGFCEGASFQTELGARPVQTLVAGDWVLADGNQFLKVRSIRRSEIPSTRNTQAIELRAPFFGLTADTIAAPQQRLLISGTTVEYLFGFEDVLLEARHLLVHPAASSKNSGPTESYFEIEFDQSCCVSVGGTWAECRNAKGQGVARQSSKASVVQIGDATSQQRSHPSLSAQEAVTLLTAMNA